MTLLTARPAAASRERSMWLIAGAVCTAVALATGCLFVWSWLTRGIQDQSRTYRQPVARVIVDLNAGDLTISPGASGEVAVERQLTWSVVKPRIEEKWDGQTLRVRAFCPTVLPARCAVSYTMRVPANVPVEARTRSGDVSVRDLLGDLRLASNSGDVNVTGGRGALWARTASGNVTAVGVASEAVNAESTSGNVSLDFDSPPGLVTAKAVSGNVEVAVPPGVTYAVDAQTLSGTRRVMADAPTAPRKIRVGAVSGDLEVSYTRP